MPYEKFDTGVALLGFLISSGLDILHFTVQYEKVSQLVAAITGGWVMKEGEFQIDRIAGLNYVSDQPSFENKHPLREGRVVCFEAIIVDTARNAGGVPSNGVRTRLLSVVHYCRNFPPEQIKHLQHNVADS